MAVSTSISIVVILLFFSISSSWELDDDSVRRKQLPFNHVCEEIYVVGEGETLYSISDKCSDPYIVEKNPHIHDPDDVYPGLVIKITPHHQNPII